MIFTTLNVDTTDSNSLRASLVAVGWLMVVEGGGLWRAVEGCEGVGRVAKQRLAYCLFFFRRCGKAVFLSYFLL